MGDPLLLRTIVMKLCAFEAELTYCIDSPLERVHSAAELAFMRLQRLIIVDDTCRASWKAAFSTHETKCEKLGALHLLWHGIGAFKVDATGAKTDLVYQDKLDTGSGQVALGLVLTEWKRADQNPSRAYEQAMRQTASYSSGALAGIELTSHRYLVVVTEKAILPPPDEASGEIIYRHINIAVDSNPPSVSATR